MTKNIFYKICVSMLFFALVGCAHYRTGTGNQPVVESLAIAPVINKSFAPQAHTLVSDALFIAFSNGGEIPLADKDQAEATLSVTLIEYNKGIAASRSDDTGRARSIFLSLKAKAVLTDKEGKQIYSGEFYVSEEAYTDSGSARSESQTVPKLAQQLGQKIYRAVSSRW